MPYDKETKELIDSCSIFAGFIQMMDAGREVDGDDRLADDQVLLNYSGPGCGVFVTVGYFRRLSEAFQRLDIARGKDSENSPPNRAD